MTRRIIKDRRITEDHWQYIDDEQSLPAGQADIIVSFQRWQNERDALIAREGGLGVIIGEAIGVEAIRDSLDDFDLVAVHFPVFKDGRGFSYARLLRERYGFKGEIRAFGNILRDQIYYMARCGFNAFELEEGRDLEQALTAFDDFRVNYQPAADGPATPAR
jgi:uncharacterized protein (DUF934 family)